MPNDPTEGVMNCKIGPTAATDQATVQVWWKLGTMWQKRVNASLFEEQIFTILFAMPSLKKIDAVTGAKKIKHLWVFLV